MTPYDRDLLALLAGDLTPDTVAARHGVDISSVEDDRALMVRALRSSLPRPRSARVSRAVLTVIAVLVPTVAVAQLVTFAPGAPALASEVNGNFQQLKTWLEQKLGPVGTASITTTGAITSAGTVTGATVNASSMTTGTQTITGSAAVGANLTVAGTLSAATLNATTSFRASNGVINGVNFRVKAGNNGTVSCDTYCLQSFEGFTGSCLGSRLSNGQFTSDCSYVPGVGAQLACLCATY